MPLLRLPRPRLEFKYRISESTALAVRDFIRDFLEVDRYASNQGGISYLVKSCYLDSRDLHTFWHTVKDSKDRYKLRIRTYGDDVDAPVFLEIKRRVNGMIVKSRARVRRDRISELLEGRMPDVADVVQSDAQDLLVAERFVQLMGRIRATPTALVVYDREAWGTRDQTTYRLTIDRHVCVWPTTSPALSPIPDTEPTRPFGETVILELKFSDIKPPWFRDLELVLGLQRTSAAKYCEGILKRGIEGFSADAVHAPFQLQSIGRGALGEDTRFASLFEGKDTVR